MKLVSFQSSPVPEDGCNSTRVFISEAVGTVSILTRPGGRVQLVCAATCRERHCRFQSSPVPEDGCNSSMSASPPLGIRRFQSSPVPEDGCNQDPGSVRGRCCGFNPHPSRRTGATLLGGRSPTLRLFQSSPVPEDGCNSEKFFEKFLEIPKFQSSPVPEDGCNLARRGGTVSLR